jgi:uncharacterized membrane protein
MDTNLAKWYAKFRGSSTFLWGLLIFIGGWLILIHSVFKLDPDFGVINLILSSEASVSLAFFAMMQEQTDLQHSEVMHAIKEMLEQSKKVDAEILETVEEIHEELEDNVH